MNKLTLVIDDCGMDELKDYLLSLDGINSVLIKNDKCISIDVSYDSKLITDDIIYLEIQTFLNIFNLPSLVSFDKHQDKKVGIYNIVSNICCEYCFKIAVDDLFNIPGIVRVDSNYIEQYCDCKFDERKKDTLIIYYDKEVITEKRMKEIEKELDI